MTLTNKSNLDLDWRGPELRFGLFPDLQCCLAHVLHKCQWWNLSRSEILIFHLIELANDIEAFCTFRQYWMIVPADHILWKWKMVKNQIDCFSCCCKVLCKRALSNLFKVRLQILSGLDNLPLVYHFTTGTGLINIWAARETSRSRNRPLDVIPVSKIVAQLRSQARFDQGSGLLKGGYCKIFL